MNNKVKKIIVQAIVAAIYFVVSFLTYPISFNGIQFRVAELLMIFCFFNRDFIFGVTLGCVMVNFTSPMGPFDALFGGLATLLSCVLFAFSRHLLIPTILAIAINSFVVGSELFFILKEPFWVSVGLVAIGEATVLIVGYVFAHILKKRKNFMNMISANHNVEFKW